ncbi:MAG: pilus assembly protein PilN [Gammaproteobacteria bacterium]|nr:MAG: pilus assembly protein PilN [Gammaproteobacteria bacterium]RLA54869.1 MAG: pilus assembly protein PilN [Gammaproteobacteria bacterium]
MANINLLPWREDHRQEKQKEFLIILAGVLVFGLLAVFAWDQWVNGRIDWQNSRNSFLQREITVLDEKVKEIKELKLRRQQMIERMEVILALQGNRPEVVKVFDEFVRAIPDGVYFVEMKRVANNISLLGYAESNSRISVLMRELDASKMFKDPNLTNVVADTKLGEQGSRFELHVKVVGRDEKDKEV